MVNENWTRWIKSSLFQHCNFYRGDLPLYFDNGERLTAKLPAFAEVRVAVANISEVSNGYFLFNVWMNIWITVAIDRNDLYAFDRASGRVQSLFHDCIPVYRYGNGPEDDQSLLGNLILQNNRNNLLETLKTAQFGQTEVDIRLVQGTVEGKYQMTLSL